MKAYLKGAIFAFSLVFLLLAGVFWADREGYFLLKHLEFQALSNQSFSESEAYVNLQNYLEKRISSYKGKSLLSINMQAMTKDLNSHVWIDKIFIRRSFPNRLHIEVKPKVWIAYLREELSFYPITSVGEILPRVDVIEGPDLPIVSIDRKKWSEGLNQSVLEILSFIPDTGLISKASLQEVRVDKEGIYLVVSPMNTIVRLGTDDLAIRLARSEKVLEYLHQRSLQGRVINSNFAQKVVVKLAKPR